MEKFRGSGGVVPCQIKIQKTILSQASEPSRTNHLHPAIHGCYNIVYLTFFFVREDERNGNKTRQFSLFSFQRTRTRNSFKGCIRDVESEYEDLRERPLDLTFSEKEDVTRVFKNVKKCGCKDLKCQNGGQCVSRLNDFRCECKLGFTGPQCETESKY